MNDNIFANNTQETISEKYVSLTEIMGYPTKMLDSEKFSELDEKLKEKIYWALNKPEEIIKKMELL